MLKMLITSLDLRHERYGLGTPRASGVSLKTCLDPIHFEERKTMKTIVANLGNQNV